MIICAFIKKYLNKKGITVQRDFQKAKIYEIIVTENQKYAVKLEDSMGDFLEKLKTIKMEINNGKK